MVSSRNVGSATVRVAVGRTGLVSSAEFPEFVECPSAATGWWAGALIVAGDGGKDCPSDRAGDGTGSAVGAGSVAGADAGR
jgi:hypothetical protein